MTAPSTYDLTSRINHWIIGLSVMGLLCAGLLLEFGGLEKPLKSDLMFLHKAFGVLVLAYGLWRVGYRLAQGFASPVANMPDWQLKASKFSHWFLLIGVILMPITGIARSYFGGKATDVFGLFTIPALPEKAEGAFTVAKMAHAYIGYALCAIVLLHIAAAIKHHFIDKDATLVRMLTGATSRNP